MEINSTNLKGIQNDFNKLKNFITKIGTVTKNNTVQHTAKSFRSLAEVVIGGSLILHDDRIAKEAGITSLKSQCQFNVKPSDHGVVGKGAKVDTLITNQDTKESVIVEYVDAIHMIDQLKTKKGIKFFFENLSSKSIKAVIDHQADSIVLVVTSVPKLSKGLQKYFDEQVEKCKDSSPYIKALFVSTKALCMYNVIKSMAVKDIDNYCKESAELLNSVMQIAYSKDYYISPEDYEAVLRNALIAYDNIGNPLSFLKDFLKGYKINKISSVSDYHKITPKAYIGRLRFIFGDIIDNIVKSRPSNVQVDEYIHMIDRVVKGTQTSKTVALNRLSSDLSAKVAAKKGKTKKVK